MKPVFELMRTVAAQEAFIAELITLQQTEELRIVMEATGIYSLPILMQLQQAGLFVSVINPLVMKRYFGENVWLMKRSERSGIKFV